MNLRVVQRLFQLPSVRGVGARSCKSSTKSDFAFFSTKTGSEDLVYTSVDNKSGVATLTLHNPPVNSLSLEMCQAISTNLKDLENNNPKVQSLVLKSSVSSILSAGLDLKEMHDPDPVRLKAFWRSFQQLYLDLYGSRFACVAAIEGHAPAAGCMLAIACDYRVMAAGNATIGLNESTFGIVAPPWLGELMISTIGQRQAEKAMGLGLLFAPEEALNIGLVDEVVPKEDVVVKASKEAAKWANIPAQARVASKQLARKKYLDHIITTREDDIDNFCSFVQTEKVQRALAMYLKHLKNKPGTE